MAHPSLEHLSVDAQLALLFERAKHVVGRLRLTEVLGRYSAEGRPLRVKYGIDATASEIHLGHAVPLFLLRRLQKMGHHVILLIGDFTARVGDPTGRVGTRPVLTHDEILSNASRYTAQAGKILDISRTEVRFNSEWLDSFKLADFFRVLGGLTVATALQRDDFRRRESVTRAEMLYSTLMAIDSAVLECDLELGGDDQLLNFYDAERVMENEGIPPEAAITTDILLGTSGDGKKMSKSSGNYVSLLAAPGEKFGKLMSIPDAQLEQYFKLLTDITDRQWEQVATSLSEGRLHPMEVKVSLARTVVSDLDGIEAARHAERDFRSRVVEKKPPAELPLVLVQASQGASWISVMRALALPRIASNSDARRLLEAGGVYLVRADGEERVAMGSPLPAPGEAVTVRVGKRTFVRFSIQ